MDNINKEDNYAIVRQPIFDKNKDVIAYNIEIKDFDDLDKDNIYIFESSKVIDKLITDDLTRISNGKKIFVRFNLDSIRREIPLSFPNTKIGINIDDTVLPDDELYEKLKKIKLKGFDLIIDGYDLKDTENSLVSLADIFTADFRIDRIKGKNSVFANEEYQQIKLLARDVETESDFNTALNKEFDYFQGNFFTHTDILPSQEIPSFKLNLIKLLKELNRHHLDLNEIEETLKRDLALTYKLLKFMNSASLGIKTTIISINHALNLLGEVELKKWLTVMVVSSIGSDKPEELLKTSLIRAKFCELISEELGLNDEKNDYFLTGMFSLIDVFVGRPLYEIINELPLKEEIKQALSGEDNQLSKILSLVKDYENGKWHDVKQALIRAELSKKRIVDFYNESIEWSNFLEKSK